MLSAVEGALSLDKKTPLTSRSSSMATELLDGSDGADSHSGGSDVEIHSLGSKTSSTSATTVVDLGDATSDGDRSPVILRQASIYSELSADTERAITDSDNGSVGNNGGSTGSSGIRPPTTSRNNKTQRLQLVAANGDGRVMERTRFGGMRYIGSGSAPSPGKAGSSSSQVAVVPAVVVGKRSKMGVSAWYPMSGEFLLFLWPPGFVFERLHARHSVGRLANLLILGCSCMILRGIGVGDEKHSFVCSG